MLDLCLFARTHTDFKLRTTASALLIALASIGPGKAWAAQNRDLDQRQEALVQIKEAQPALPENSAMDGEMFYQLLIAEINAHSGDPGAAYQIYLELAKRYQNSQLYQRAVTIALQARAGEQALTAAKAWRKAMPQSREACEYTTQILLALDRTADLAPPLRAMIQLTPVSQQPQVLMSLPRVMTRLSDKAAAAQVIEDATQPWRQPPLETAEAWIATSEAWLLAKENEKAVAALKKAAALKPLHLMVGLIGTDLMPASKEAEAIVQNQLKSPDVAPLVRLSYARRLASLQRLPEAAQQLEQLVQAQPTQSAAWLTLALVRFEQQQYELADKAALKVLDLHGQSERPGALARPSNNKAKPAVAALPAQAASSAPDDEADEEDTPPDTGPKGELEQANLLLSQIAEKQGHLNQAIGWLDLADPQHVKMAVQNQRAHLLVKLGKMDQARAGIRAIPEQDQQDGVSKIQLEAQLLRENNDSPEAQKVLTDGLDRFPNDSDLMYDLAMICEKLKQYDRMEALLRKVMTLNVDDPNAYNALGYSLADRNIRLDEARKLLEKALALRPADPFITDSLAWLEYREGHPEEAIKLLKQALSAKPDGEIAAHLIEILWTSGQQDEARRVLKDAIVRDPNNEAIKATVERLHISM
ncbi:MAG: tetratricopeptide repeat protein [Burkholderiales bacterium]|nr:tetratricopeptide repeat protein [Burkholderiales bacterium]